jgi:hypothetical protein
VWRRDDFRTDSRGERFLSQSTADHFALPRLSWYGHGDHGALAEIDRYLDAPTNVVPLRLTG